MSIFKKIEKGLRNVKDKIVDDIIPNEFKSGAKAKESLRKLIPNELADVAVKAAPFVAPFSPETAAAMRAFGRFDQRGSISDALKQGAMMYAGGKGVGMIPGTGNYFGQGLEGAKALGTDAMSGITSIFKGGGKNAANEIIKGSPKGMPDFSGMTRGGGAVKDKGIMSTIFDKGVDYGKQYLFGDDKEFQMGDIGRFLGDPGKTVPLTMIASYIKEKFFPDEDQDSFDAKFAEAMRKRGENVESYLQQYGPFDPRRDPTKNPYTQEEIDQFARDKTIEYRNVAADGGIMSVPRENYFLGSKAFTVNPNPDFERASKVTPDDILNVFKKKFDGGNFFKGRRLPEKPFQLGQPLPVGTTRRSLGNVGKIPKESKVSPDDILNVFKKKFDEGNFFGSGGPRIALPMRQVSATFSPKKALTAERAFDVDETGREIRDFFERRLSGMPASFRPEIKNNEEIIELLTKGDRKGLDALMTSLLRDANFDREEAAMGGRMNYARGSEGIMMASVDDPFFKDSDADENSFRMFNKPYKDLTPDELEEFQEEMIRLMNKFASDPDPMDERNQVLEMMSMQEFGKPLKDLTDDQIIELEEMFDDFVRSGQPLPSDPTKPINPFAPKPTGPALPDKQIAFMDDDYEQEFMRLVGEFMEQGFTQEEAIEAARDELARKTMAVGGRVNYAMGGDTPEENAMQAAGIEGLDININPKGITELDMRETGGFIPPVGVKEKEDDIPAMLSNNEFVFTADAVRGMGDGDVDKGAERMYSMMKKLEDGGRV